MEWDMKTPWDFENMGMVSSKNDGGGLQELGKETEHNVSSATNPFSREEGKSQVDCFVDLQLGRLGDFGDGLRPRNPRETRVSAMGSPGSSRRTRTVNSSNQAVFCLVEGCNSDFSSCKDYHKKHKVCDVHSKTPKVIVGGREQRFCQQCSRFHLLAEFDEGKRSCRTRLDGHNKRRRKQQPEFMPGSSGNLFANFQGTGFSSYINAPTFPPTVQDPYWTGVVKAEEDGTRGHRPPLPLMSPVPRSSYNVGKSFPFLHTSDTIASSGSSSQILADGFTRALNSDCALSLLSSSAQPSGISLGHIAHAERIPIAQPLVQVTQYNYNYPARFPPEKLLPVASYSQGSNSVSSTGFSCSGMEGEQVSVVLVPDSSDADIHLQGILHVADIGNSQGEHTQTHPFSWQ